MKLNQLTKFSNYSFILVVLSALASGYFKYTLIHKFFFIKDEFSLFTINFTIFGEMIYTIVIWFVIVIISYFSSLLMNGHGKFKDQLLLTGFGYVFILISFAVRFILISKLKVPEPMYRFFFITDPTMQVVSIIDSTGTILLVLWSVFIVKYVHHLSILKSVLTLLIPGLSIYLIKTLIVSI